MKEIIIVGKMYKRDRTNGPTAVMFSLKEAFDDKGLNCSTIVMNEDCSKIEYLIGLLKLIKAKDKIINVHINGFVSALIVYCIYLLNKKNDYYLTVHGIYREQTKYYDAAGPKRIYYAIERVINRNFPNIICVSELCKNTLIKNYHPKGRIFVIGNGIESIDSTIVKRTEIGKKLIFVGGLQGVKGIDKILSIMKYVVKQDKGVYLEIYGECNEEKVRKLNSLLEDEKLTENVTYGGMVKSREELFCLYKTADYHIAMSYFDTFNTAIIESINCGCLNITNLMSGAASILDSNSGFLIDENMTNEEIANDICKILNTIDVEQYNNMANCAKSKIMEYTWEKIAEKYVHVLNVGD